MITASSVSKKPRAVHQNAPLLSLRNSCVFNFSALKYDLGIERLPDKEPLSEGDLDEFAKQAEHIHAVVSDSLGLTEYTRIGFRAWYLFRCPSREDSEQWLRQLGCFELEDKLIGAFGSEIDAASVSVVIAGEDRKFRVAFNGVELQAQIDFGEAILSVRPRDLHEEQRRVLRDQERVKKRMRQSPEFAVMIDIDAFQEDPQVISPADFIHTSIARFLPALSKATT